MKIYVPNNQTVSQPLTLECSVTTVRGITSRVDILWSSDGVELKWIQEVNTSFTNNNTELYKDAYSIPLLSTNDEDRVFECEAVIMTTPSTVATDNVTLDVIGKWHKVLHAL